MSLSNCWDNPRDVSLRAVASQWHHGMGGRYVRRSVALPCSYLPVLPTLDEIEHAEARLNERIAQRACYLLIQPRPWETAHRRQGRIACVVRRWPRLDEMLPLTHDSQHCISPTLICCGL